MSGTTRLNILEPIDHTAACSRPKARDTTMVWLAVCNCNPRLNKKMSFP